VIGEWPDQWKVPVVDKKGKKGKEQAGTGQSSSPTTNTRKESQCTQPTESRETIKKQRKKETIPRASVLETEHIEGTNEEAHKNDKIPR
jgi:hypothetical protein